MTENDIFIIKSKEIHLDIYDYININYIDNVTKVEIICKEHGSFFQKPQTHKNGSGCPKCGRLSTKNKNTKNNTWLKDFLKIHNDKYDYSKVIYTNAINKVEIICKEHGSFFQRISDHKSGRGCPKCGKVKAIRSKLNIIEDFIKIHNNRYNYDNVSYIDNRTKVEIICKVHGSFLQRPLSHITGSGCPTCKLSKGESKIIKFIKEKSINYITQYNFNDCLSNLQKKLSFDFYLPESNMCIEYDGIQHFESIEFFGGVNRLEKQKLNDNIKNKYCIDNSIKLLRIPYNKFDDIDDILTHEIH